MDFSKMGNLNGKLDEMPFRFFAPIIVFLHPNILNSFVKFGAWERRDRLQNLFCQFIQLITVKNCQRSSCGSPFKPPLLAGRPLTAFYFSCREFYPIRGDHANSYVRLSVKSFIHCMDMKVPIGKSGSSGIQFQTIKNFKSLSF